MSTLRVKENGQWRIVPILGSYKALTEVNRIAADIEGYDNYIYVGGEEPTAENAYAWIDTSKDSDNVSELMQAVVAAQQAAIEVGNSVSQAEALLSTLPSNITEYINNINTNINAINNALTTKADKNDVYTRQDVYTKTEINSMLRFAAGHDNVVYGFRIDNNESDPAASVVYLADAIGMTPARMDFQNNIFDYGSWENAFFMPKPCMLNYNGTVAYYLDKDNYALKEDGTPSDIADSNFEGNAMMEWGQNGKKIYYKITPVRDGVADIYISDHKADDDFVCYSFIGGSNQELDHFYTPIYNGCNVSNKLRSLSGKRQMVTQAGTTEISYAQANGSGWYIEQWCDRVLINLLLTLMGKSLDMERVFGNGHYSGGSAESSNLSTGTMDGKGLFWGTNGNDGVKLFGMENWYANTWRRTAGLMNRNGTYLVKMTSNTYDGSTATTYNTTGDGYLSMGSVPAASQSYISKMAFNSKCMLPSVVSGSASTYYCDGMWSNNGRLNFAFLGGVSSGGSLCGGWAVDLSSAVSLAHWSIGACLSYKNP